MRQHPLAITLPFGLPAALVMLSGSAAALAENAPREVSKDGRITAVVSASPSDNTGRVERGSFVPYTMIPDWSLNLRRQIGAVRIADMNGDGLNDLVACCFNSSSFPPYDNWQDMIFYNTGTTLEAVPSWISADQIHTGDAQIGDVNDDGKNDLVAISGGGGFAPPRVYYSNPAPGMGPSTSPGWLATPPTSGWATSGALFDIDNDNDLDLVTTNQGVSPNANRPMYFFRNLGTALETSPSWQSAESSIQNTVAAADFDGDGDLDIAVAKWAGFTSAIYETNAGTLDTTPTWLSGTGTNRGIAWADVDGNGTPDLVIGGSSSTIQSRLYSNSAPPGGTLTQTWQAALAFVGQQETAFNDIDQDGDPDYAEVHFSNGQTHLFLNNGGTLATTPAWTFDAAEVGNALDFGDINGDGWNDLAIGYSGNTSIRVFFAVPPKVPACPGDADGDRMVGLSDIAAIVTAWGMMVTPGTGADLDGSGDVGLGDIAVVVQNWGTVCP